MTLTAGTRLGPYEIVAPLGAGGMGEVYRARDPRLGRDVAIKVLPQHLSANAEVCARFEREAKTVSSLNHPNICTLFDVGREGDTDYLVMELVEGETLADRLARGPLPTNALFKAAVEIVNGLEKAHRAGVVHRDLKPGNVMLTKSGAKLMDFGLARATGLEGSGSGLSQSPTMTRPLTAEGAIVGTFQYMAPEQLEGKDADARSDLFAFGAVLYEMATGKKAFEGRSQASLIAAILEREPAPISAIAPMAPPALERVVKRCMAKDPEDRWQSARDLLHELEWMRDAGSQAGVPAPVARRRVSRERLAWTVAAVGLAVGIAAPAIVLRLRPATKELPVTRFSIAAPENATFIAETAMSAISPDGRTLTFIAADSGGTVRLWVRPLESLTPRPLAGTENASLPFWSPDSRTIGFFSGDGKLKKVPSAGGAPEVICEAGDGRGANWGSSGVIVFAPEAAGPLYRVSANGGERTPVTSLDSTRRESGHRWPCFLPDGKHFLFVGLPTRQGNYDFFMGSLDSKETRFMGSASAAPIFAAPGYLVYVRNTSLVAQRFDPQRRKSIGEPTTLGEAPPPSGYSGAPTVTASMNGTLAHMGAGLPNTELHWFDRSGNAAGTVSVPAGRYESVRLSPDGKRLCVARRSSASEEDLWLVDLDRPVPTRLTFGPAQNFYQVWSPDGQTIGFASDRSGPEDIFIKATNGANEEMPLLVGGALFKEPDSWSPDGRFIVFEEPNERTGWDMWLLPVEGEHKPIPYLRTPFNDRRGVVSPDGRWMAYYSDESGAPETYVQSFPTPGSKYQVSTGGSGYFVGWSRGGRELIYLGSDGFTLLAVDVTTDPTFRPGAPRRLLKLRQDYVAFDVTPDGQRVLVVAPAGQGSATTITVSQNWTAGLEKP